MTRSPAGRRGKVRFDLHLHSSRSDGEFSPDEVLRRCARGGLDVIALTDHDIGPAIEAGPVEVEGRRLHVVHGAELSGVHEGEEFHLLVYFSGEMPTPFAEFLRERSSLRARRYDQAIENIGLPGLAPADALANRGDRAVTRLHLSQALVQAGHVRNLREAFKRFTGRQHGLVPSVELDFIEAIEVTRAAGGFTSWAHPSLEAARAHSATFARHGLQALEAWRPRMSAHDRAVLMRMALRHGLLITGGSDWHGWGHPEVGRFAFPERLARPFAEALKIVA